jgi:hypothetical protein
MVFFQKSNQVQLFHYGFEVDSRRKRLEDTKHFWPLILARKTLGRRQVILSMYISERNFWWPLGISFHKFLWEKHLVIAKGFSTRITATKTPANC